MHLPLAERYYRFREEVFSSPGSLSEPSAALLQSYSELQLQSLWFAGAFGTHFTTTDGRGVVIRDFGVWNSGAGADFIHCSLLLDGEKLSGCIELDPDVRDWERHGHGTNPDYRDAILHLYFTSPSGSECYTRTVEHKLVPQVQLSLAMLPQDSPCSRPLAAAHLGRCALPLSQMAEERITSLLESAAQHRLQRKSQRLHRLIQAQGKEQALYQSLAAALGYRGNTAAFELLAQRLPLRTLLPLLPVEREALLFGVAGFTEDTPFDETRADTRGYLRSLWEHWWKQRSLYARWLYPAHQRLPWKFSATRPGNHPQRRLAALGAVLSSWGKVCHMLHQPSKWHRQTWSSHLAALTHDYWSTHYTLLAAPAAKPVALVGETRVREILANVIYPLLLPERTDLWAEYVDLPALLENQKVQRACLRLFGPQSPLAKRFTRKLYHHQGLLQVYEDFCLEDDSACADCPFPQRLQQW